MEKNELRKFLFNEYFKVTDGIKASEFVDKIAFIRETWQKLCDNLSVNCESYYPSFTPEAFKKISYNNNEYLIIKISSWKYLIINLNNNKVLDEELAKSIFDDNFFINNFNETIIDNNLSMYEFFDYKGNINDLIDFYVLNEEIFSLPAYIIYKIKLMNAYTYFYISLNQEYAYLAFQTIDQFLYEQLFFKGDLNPSHMQDAVKKISEEQVKEIFTKIKDIVIPYMVIPDKLLKIISNNYKKIIK